MILIEPDIPEPLILLLLLKEPFLALSRTCVHHRMICVWHFCSIAPMSGSTTIRNPQPAGGICPGAERIFQNMHLPV